MPRMRSMGSGRAAVRRKMARTARTSRRRMRRAPWAVIAIVTWRTWPARWEVLGSSSPTGSILGSIPINMLGPVSFVNRDPGTQPLPNLVCE